MKRDSCSFSLLSSRGHHWRHNPKNITAQLQCSSKVMEFMRPPCLPLLARGSAHPVGITAAMLESWIGLSPQEAASLLSWQGYPGLEIQIAQLCCKMYNNVLQIICTLKSAIRQLHPQCNTFSSENPSAFENMRKRWGCVGFLTSWQLYASFLCNAFIWFHEQLHSLALCHQ